MPESFQKKLIERRVIIMKIFHTFLSLCPFSTRHASPRVLCGMSSSVVIWTFITTLLWPPVSSERWLKWQKARRICTFEQADSWTTRRPINSEACSVIVFNLVTDSSTPRWLTALKRPLTLLHKQVIITPAANPLFLSENNLSFSLEISFLLKSVGVLFYQAAPLISPRRLACSTLAKWHMQFPASSYARHACPTIHPNRACRFYIWWEANLWYNGSTRLLDGNCRGVLQDFTPTLETISTPQAFEDESIGNRVSRHHFRESIGLQIKKSAVLGSLQRYERCFFGALPHIWSKIPQWIPQLGQRNGWKTITNRCKSFLTGKMPCIQKVSLNQELNSSMSLSADEIESHRLNEWNRSLRGRPDPG